VRLYDADPVITGVWDYLINTSEDEIRRLPLGVANIDDLEGVIPKAAQNLIGFWLNHGTTRPSKSASSWMRKGTHNSSFWGPEIRERIATQVQYIRHWSIDLASYECMVDWDATWFIDPPYATPAGRHYRLNDIDYDHLGKWCQERRGQVIVCEQQGADWLPFESIGAFKSTLGSTKEVVWLND
jgi:hypothetical protein